MSNNFDWQGSQSVVIPAVQAVAVYENEDGDVVIRQEHYAGGEDETIIIPRQHARVVAKAINDLLKPPLNPSFKKPAL